MITVKLKANIHFNYHHRGLHYQSEETQHLHAAKPAIYHNLISCQALVFPGKYSNYSKYSKNKKIKFNISINSLIFEEFMFRQKAARKRFIKIFIAQRKHAQN